MTITKQRTTGYIAAVLLMVFVLVFSGFNRDHGDAATVNQLQEQSAQLKEKIAQNKQRAEEFHAHALSLQSKISGLNEEIYIVNQEIELLNLQIQELKLRIEITNQELEKQKALLGENIKAMYLEGDISTIEMLASSNNLSDYIDKEQYRNAVKDKITDTLAEINRLKFELREKKQKVEGLLEEQQTQYEALAAKKYEKQQLLNQTQGQEAKYREIVAKQQKELEKAEAALIAALSTGSYRVAPVGPVSAGEVIGSIGNSGLSSGPHLHLEVRDGGIRNPTPYIKHPPVIPTVISQHFGNADPIYISGYHPGIDYLPGNGAIHAIDSGYLYRGCSNQLLGTNSNPYGYVAIIEHSGGWVSIYAHMAGGPSACNYNTYY